MIGRTASDLRPSTGLYTALDFGTGSNFHQLFGFDVALVLADNHRPGGKFFPEFGISVLDHVHPVQKNALAAARAVGLSAQNVHVRVDLIDAF